VDGQPRKGIEAILSGTLTTPGGLHSLVSMATGNDVQNSTSRPSCLNLTALDGWRGLKIQLGRRPPVG